HCRAIASCGGPTWSSHYTRRQKVLCCHGSGGLICDSSFDFGAPTGVRAWTHPSRLGPCSLRSRSDMIRSIELCSLLAVALGGIPAANAQSDPGSTAPGQAASYAVDGRMLGARLASDRSTRDYKCSPSEQFNGFTWCQRTVREATTSILHAKDGTI